MPYANPLDKTASTRRRCHRRRDLLMAIKSESGCLDCGERNPIVLDFPHRIPSEKLSNINRARTWRWERVLKEIAKCDVLCANCHRIREWERHEKTN